MRKNDIQTLESGKYYKRIRYTGCRYLYAKKVRYNEIPECLIIEESTGKYIFSISFGFFTDIYNKYEEISKEEFDNVFRHYTEKLIELNN